MYNFLDKPVSRQDKKRLQPEVAVDEFDEFEKVIQENKVVIVTMYSELLK